MTLARAANGMQVLRAAHPFGPVAVLERPFGLTVAEIVASVPGLPDAFARCGIVRRDGVDIPRDEWHRALAPGDAAMLTLHMPQLMGGGGGGGKDPTRYIITLAAVVLAIAVTGGAFAGVVPGLFAAHSTSAALLAFGITTVGGLVAHALSPPPVATPLAAPASGQGGSRTQNAASAQGNQLARGDAILGVFGTMKVYPQLACQPLVQRIGDDEYVEFVCVMDGPHATELRRLGASDIDNMDDVEYEEISGLPGSGRVSLVQRYGFTDTPNVELSRPTIDPDAPANLLHQDDPWRDVPSWANVTSNRDPDEIWLVLNFGEGIVDYADPTQSYAVPLRCQIRRWGDVPWTNLPEIHFRSSNSLPLRKRLDFHFAPPPLSMSKAPGNDGPWLAYNSVPGQTAFPATGGWQASPYFSGGTTGASYYAASTYDGHDVRNVVLAADGVDVYLDPAVFPPDRYEIRLRLGTLYNVNSFTVASYAYSGSVRDFFEYSISGATAVIARTRAQVHDRCLIERVVTVRHEHPIARPDYLWQFAVRAKNKQLEPFSCIASGYARDWNGTEWGTWTTTSNPAPHFNEALAGPLNAKPVKLAKIDNAGLVAFRQACELNGYRVNAIRQGMSNEDARVLLAACGFATVKGGSFGGGKYGVIRDRDRSAEIPAQVWSSANLSAFRCEKAWPVAIDGYRVLFQNADLDYEEDELIVLRDGVDPDAADRLEVLRLAGKVTTDEAELSARHALDYLIKRTTFYYGTASIAALESARGDLNGIQHDTIARAAGAARILDVERDGDGFVTALLLDRSVPSPGTQFLKPRRFLSSSNFIGGAKHGLAVTCTDRSTMVLPLADDASGADDTEVVTLETPFADARGLIGPGCRIVTGLRGQEYLRTVVKAIEKGREPGTFDITWVDEANDLFRTGAARTASSIDTLSSATARASTA